jgi:hypothetical protein
LLRQVFKELGRSDLDKKTLNDYVSKQFAKVIFWRISQAEGFEKCASLGPRNIFEITCGFLLHPPPQYARLPPVSQSFTACKHLKVQHLKLNFNSRRVFHSAVENPVENFRRECSKECFCNTF